MMESVLAHIDISDVQTKPFPYVSKIGAVIDGELCKRLIAEYPSLETVSRGMMLQGRPYTSNEKVRYFAKDVLELKEVTPLWREFVEAHLTRDHYNHVLRLFKPHIKNVYPGIEKKYGPLEKLHIGIRHIDSYDTCDVLLDAELCTDTPVDTPSSVKSAHLDSLDKLLVGNFYLRRPDDDSQGGALELFAFKPDMIRFYGKRFADHAYLTKIGEVPYQSNNLSCFINSLHSLHGVGVREVTPHVRYSFNFILEFKDPLFSLDAYYPMTSRHVARVLYTKTRALLGLS